MTEVEGGRKYYGKYKGTVVQNADPMFRGRLMVLVPDILGPAVPSSWAEPCTTYWRRCMGGVRAR
jgi:hypothetical protein